MKKDKIVKIIVSVIGIVIIIFGINICIAAKRIDKYSCLTPLENLTFTERIAAKLNNSSFKSRELLKKDGLLMSDESIKKDNEKNLNKTEEKIECNYTKHELDTMDINSTKYIGKELECTGTIISDMLDEHDSMNIDAIVVKIKDTNVVVTMICDKDKIDYNTWKKGTTLKIKGKIKKIENTSGVEITLNDFPTIEK